MALENLFGELALDQTVQEVLVELEKANAATRLEMDFTGRTDAQPIYLGLAGPNVAAAVAEWRVLKFQYESASDDARLLRFDAREDIKWTNRTDPTQDGQPAWGF